MSFLKTRLFLIFIFVSLSVFAGNKNSSLFNELIRTLNDRHIYVVEKEQRIENIKKIITPETPLLQEFQINENLRKEYFAFQSDSAIHYVQRNYEIAKILKKQDLIWESELHLSSLYSLVGLSVDAESLLRRITSHELSANLQALYFESMLNFLSRTYAVNNKISKSSEIFLYRDSLINILETQTYMYRLQKANIDIDRGNLDTAKENLLLMMEEEPGFTHRYAMITHLLASIYQRENDLVQAKDYYTLSTIADMKNAVKENASSRMLALMYYDEGNIELAYKLTQTAIEDAIFGNMQFRTIRLSQFYSIINTTYLSWELERKEQLKMYILLISFLSLFLIIAVVYVYMQMRKVSKIKEVLSQINAKLLKLNEEISDANRQLKENNLLLSEANHVKEEYIAHFFDLCSTYINKLENYRRILHKKAMSNQLDDLFMILKSKTIVEDELEELYVNFDTIFLNLYPTFVEDFNKLLISEEQVYLKSGELLNTELRIFALIRLGITDSVKIAAFLRYSLSTIYNYRTKTRNKAVISRDEFENQVMKIGKIIDKN